MKSVNNLKDLFYFSLLAASPIYSKEIRLFPGFLEDCQNVHSINIGLELASFHIFIFIILVH